MLNTFFILALAASIQSAEIRSDVTIGSKMGDCSLVTFNGCTIDGIIEAVQEPSAEACQKNCKVFVEKCQAFIHNGTTCTLLSKTVAEHVATCRQVAGPATPPIDECLATTDPCEFFHEETCKYENEIRHFEGVATPGLCQEACQLASGCAYFQYYFNTLDCYMYDTTQKSCSVNVGPKIPLLEECTPTPPPVPELCTTEVYKKSDGTCACGLFLEDNHSWFDGVDQCSALNARLPEIYSAEENSDLTRIVGGNIWLGANDIESENNFVWQSGLPVSYSHWRAGEPNNIGGEQCLEFYSDGDWNDMSCDFLRPVFCELVFKC